MLNNPLALAALAAALLCFATFFALDRMVSHGATEAFDRRGITALRLPSGKPRGGMAVAPVMRLLTQFGGPVLRYAIAIPAAVALYRLGFVCTALWLVSALGSGWVVDGIFKHIFHRKRPTIVPHLAHAGGPSFPSGHTFNASLVYCALALASMPVLGWTAATIALGGAVLLSLAVGFSRVWLGVHWPTDVTAGWLLGTGWWLGAYAFGGSLLGR